MELSVRPGIYFAISAHLLYHTPTDLENWFTFSKSTRLTCSQTFYERLRVYTPQHMSRRPVSPQGSGDCAIVLGTACLSDHPTLMQSGSTFLVHVSELIQVSFHLLLLSMALLLVLDSTLSANGVNTEHPSGSVDARQSFSNSFLGAFELLSVTDHPQPSSSRPLYYALLALPRACRWFSGYIKSSK